jgi:hypothetical protein
MEYWVINGDGSRNLTRDRKSLRVKRLYRKVEGGEGVTWVLSISFNV